MQTIRMNTHIGTDGVLKLEVPLEMANTDLEILLVLQPISNRSWPKNYFEETAGSLADDPLERPPQGDYEVREPIP